MTRLFVAAAALGKARVHVRGAELRHLKTVLRLGPGARLEVFDGEGRAFEAEVVSVGGSSAELALGEPVRAARESPLAVTLAVGLAKGGKLDWVVEKATELGVARIAPFTSERTVPERERLGARLERLRRIARAAAAQSGRARAPEVVELSPFADVVAAAGAHDRAILFWEEGGAPLDAGAARAPARLLLACGAEGGFAEEEVRAARAAGFAIATLGPRILRAETAAIAALTAAQLVWGDLRLVSAGGLP